MCGENLGKKKIFVQRSDMIGGSVMVWGCTAASGVGNIHFNKGSITKSIF
jgi:hypothetical protein